MRIVLLGLMLVGCITTVPQQGNFEGTGAWEEPSGDWLAILSWGCGFCSGTTEEPEFSGIAYFEGGSVLTFEYGFWTDGQKLDVPEAYKPYVSEIIGSEIYYNGSVRVHDIGVESIAHEAFEEKLQFHLNAASTAEKLYEVTDCGPAHLQTQSELTLLGCGWEGDWHHHEAQRLLEELYAWMQDS